MLSFHHVNLGVPVGGLDAQATFLVDVLGFRRIEPAPVGASWFEADDGKQIHLSEDAEHRPAARAHVAVELGDSLGRLAEKFDDTHYRYRSVDSDGRRTVLCKDPSGNRWELRGTLPG